MAGSGMTRIAHAPWRVRRSGLALGLVIAFGLPGPGFAETEGEDRARLCSELFERWAVAQAAFEQAEAQGTTLPREDWFGVMDLVHALPGTLCAEAELIAFFEGVAWELDDARGGGIPGDDLGVRVLKFTYTPPLFEHFFAKLLIGFGPSTLVSVSMMGDRVVFAQSQGIK